MEIPLTRAEFRGFKKLSYFIYIAAILAMFSIFAGGVQAYVANNPTTDDYLVSTIIDDDYDAGSGYDNLKGVADVKAVGDYLYVTATIDDTFSIFDISDPTDPQLEGSVTTTGTAATNTLEMADRIVIQGDYAYVLAESGGTHDHLNVIDISDKTSPTIVGSIGTYGNTAGSYFDGPKDLAVSGDYVYVVSQTKDAVNVIDVSTKSSPTTVTTIRDGVGGFNYLDQVNNVVIDGDELYVSSHIEDAITIIDVSTPTSPTLIEEIPNGTGDLLESIDLINDIYVDGDELYVVAGSDADASDGFTFLLILDISDPSDPSLIANLEEDQFEHMGMRYGHEILIHGQLAYFPASSGTQLVSMSVFNIAVPSDVQHLTDFFQSEGWDQLNAPRMTHNGTNLVVSSSEYTESIAILGASSVKKAQVYDRELFPSIYTEVNNIKQHEWTEFWDDGSGYRQHRGEHYLPVDTTKSYKVRGDFRSIGNNSSATFFFGFVEFTDQRLQTTPKLVQRVSPTSDVVTFDSIASDNETITVTSTIPSTWCADSSDTYVHLETSATSSCAANGNRTLAIYLDGDITKQPDHIFTFVTTSGTTIVMQDALPELVVGALNSSTKFLHHGDGKTWNYAGAYYGTVDEDEWYEFESDPVTGEHFSVYWDKFRTGTEYIKPLVFVTSGKLQMRNLTVVEVDTTTGEETSINIPEITNQDVRPKYQCDDGGYYVSWDTENEQLHTAEGTYDYDVYCQDPVVGSTVKRDVTFEIDKTAPSAPTWDAISAGTYTGPQSVFVTPDTDHTILFYGGANSESMAWNPYVEGTTMTADGASNRTYDLRVRQMDPAGNISGYSSTYSYTITP